MAVFFSTDKAGQDCECKRIANETCRFTGRLREVPGNYYRLNRVLEILLATGRPLAELDLDVGAPLDYDFRCFFLNRPRVELYRRIDARCEEMVVGGLLQVGNAQVHLSVLSLHCCTGALHALICRTDCHKMLALLAAIPCE